MLKNGIGKWVRRRIASSFRLQTPRKSWVASSAQCSAIVKAKATHARPKVTCSMAVSLWLESVHPFVRETVTNSRSTGRHGYTGSSGRAPIPVHDARAPTGPQKVRQKTRRSMQFRFPAVLGAVLAATFFVQGQTTQTNPIKLTVDLTEAPRKLIHGHMTIPVTPGPLTLLYAKWIPGEHMPDGPIDNLTGIFITGNGAPIRWVRDDVDMYA